MYYTYILKSIAQPGAIYIGYTHDLKVRISQHNDPNNTGYTKRYAPWAVETYISFSEEQQAKDFEQYLKSTSGHTFLRKRLITTDFRQALEEFNNGREDSSAKL